MNNQDSRDLNSGISEFKRGHQGGARTFQSNSIWKMETFPDQWTESTITSIYKMGNKTNCSNYSMFSLLYPISFSPDISGIIGDHQCVSDVTEQLLIRFSVLSDIGGKMGVQ
jgi:hypothetical protein